MKPEDGPDKFNIYVYFEETRKLSPRGLPIQRLRLAVFGCKVEGHVYLRELLNLWGGGVHPVADFLGPRGNSVAVPHATTVCMDT